MHSLKLKFLTITILGLISGIKCQYFFSTEFGQNQANLRNQQFGNFGFFGNRNGNRNEQSSASASAGGGSFPSSSSSSSASASAGGFPASASTGLNSALQETFREIFDWNKDLAQDPRFQRCTVPDIGNVERACPKRAFYSSLNPDHRMAVGMIKRILTAPNNAEQTVCLAGAMRDLNGVNPNAWVRGMLAAHLSDSNSGLFDLQVPPMVEVMPHIFINREFLQDAKQQGRASPQRRRCVRVDGSVGVDNGIENRLWYFREDVQVNSFHLNWHLIYPFTGIQRKANRQGELFYFTHHSHMARYHAERLSNGLRRVVPLDVNYQTPVQEHYFPHLDDFNSGMNWTARRPNRIPGDTMFLNITGIPPTVIVGDRVLHVRRVEDSIREGNLLLPNGRRMRLDSRTGIDILGDVIEASIFSPNPDYYGQFGLHNEGHVLLGFIEDPQNRTNIPPGVMVEVATAMRDPVFYTYHTAMDNTFDLHKQQLPPYQPDQGELPLRWDGIEIRSMEVLPEDGLSNRLTTFFSQKMFELSRGLDFNRTGVQGSIPACVQHLDHTPFQYKIYVNRRAHASERGTVRIFMAPRFDEFGRRYSMMEQRRLFFMLDLFTVRLQTGMNRITRRSTESALTIDIPQSLSQIGQSRPDKIKERPRTYCGCGWPHHLLIPRGTESGMSFDLFVILTNGNEDYIAPENLNPRPTECKPAPIYCGRLNDTYPDARPMGYPFDRLPYSAATHYWEKPRVVKDLEEYVTGVPNMASVPITIAHLSGSQGPQNVVRFEEPVPIPPPSQPQVQFPGPGQTEGKTQAFPESNNFNQQQGGFGSQPQIESFDQVPLIHQEHGLVPLNEELRPEHRDNSNGYETEASEDRRNVQNNNDYFAPIQQRPFHSHDFFRNFGNHQYPHQQQNNPALSISQSHSYFYNTKHFQPRGHFQDYGYA